MFLSLCLLLTSLFFLFFILSLAISSFFSLLSKQCFFFGFLSLLILLPFSFHPFTFLKGWSLISYLYVSIYISYSYFLNFFRRQFFFFISFPRFLYLFFIPLLSDIIPIFLFVSPFISQAFIFSFMLSVSFLIPFISYPSCFFVISTIYFFHSIYFFTIVCFPTVLFSFIFSFILLSFKPNLFFSHFSYIFFYSLFLCHGSSFSFIACIFIFFFPPFIIFFFFINFLSFPNYRHFPLLHIVYGTLMYG